MLINFKSNYNVIFQANKLLQTKYAADNDHQQSIQWETLAPNKLRLYFNVYINSIQNFQQKRQFIKKFDGNRTKFNFGILILLISR